MSSPLTIETIAKAVVIYFNRPEARSPISAAVLEALDQALDKIAVSPGVDRLIFTGQAGVFASGADLREIARLTPDSARSFASKGQGIMSRIENLHCRTIAAINGICFGGALDLALSCDARIASPDALFSHPGVKLGIITGWGGTQKLPRLIGQTRASEMLLTGGRLSAQTALKWGLVDAVSGNVLEAALKFAARG